jgi:diguanylate cyclase (GGDEF)-like protein
MSGPPKKDSWSRRVRPLHSLMLFGGLALVVLAIGITIVARALTSSFSELEHEATQQKAEQVYRAFEADLQQLAISNRDYAEWDDAEEFIHKRDPEFVLGNFSAETLSAMHVDVVWIVDAAGKDIYSTYLERSTGNAISPAPTAMLEQLRRFQSKERALRERSPAERTVLTGRGLAAVSAIEITRSNFSDATGAIMLFARYVEASDIARVATTSHLPVEMTLLGGNPQPAQALPGEVRTWAREAQGPTYIRTSGHDSITGYSLVRDIDQKPVALFATTGSRDIFALGMRTTWYLLACIVALFVVFGALAGGLILRLLALQTRAFQHREEVEKQERENKRNLVRQSQRDSLTGLPNRVYLQARMPRLLQALAGSDRLLAVICLDLDHFKTVNDSRGHKCGDKLLQVVARRLRAAVSEHDLVARTGGDEFAIVASLMPDMAAISTLAERLQAALSADIMVEGRPVTISASMGVAVCPQDGTDMEALFKRADIALFQAKDAGRTCHQFFSSGTDLRIRADAELEQALRQAITANELYMDFQPIVSLTDGRVASLEALMRWKHPELGLISPAQFVPIAEKSGLIMDVGLLALRQVLAQQRRWLDAGVPIVPIAVNVSPMQLERQDFAALVAQMTAEADVDPQWVRFEITESAMMKEPGRLVGTLQALRDRGSKVLIDDFGTGYSSLSYLDRLPVDILKIDRAFVRDMVGAGGHSPIVGAVIDMARRLRLSTIAEGVESREQAAMLLEAGCDFAQGFLYSKPVSAMHCGDLLERLRGDTPISETVVARVLRVG